MAGTATVDQTTLENATNALNSAKQAIDAGRESMDKCNKQVDELLKKQEAIEKGRAEDGETLGEVKQKLSDLATRMEDIAKQHTANVELVRGQMKLVGQNTDGGTERGAYMYRHPNAKGAIFESRRQALEIGMYFMATMKKGKDARQYARKWLQEHKNDLRYLPQIPDSFVQDFGNEWSQQMEKVLRGDMYIQDLGGSTTPGSVLVSPQFVNTLIRNVEEHGVFRQEALIWPMASDTVHIPKRVSGVAVTWEGEASAPSETDPSFTLLTMTAKKMIMLHQFSSELNEDAAIALADIMMFEFSLAIATEEDRIGFNGDGTGGNSPGFAGFYGVLNGQDVQTVTGAAGNDLSTEITLKKLREMTGKLHTWAEAGAKWYANRTVVADMMGIETTGGGPVVSFMEGNKPSALGHMIRRVEGMPASSAISASTRALALGDLRKSWILGDRRTPQIETSEHYSFNTDQLTTRVTARVSFLEQQGEGMVIYITGTA